MLLREVLAHSEAQLSNCACDGPCWSKTMIRRDGPDHRHGISQCRKRSSTSCGRPVRFHEGYGRSAKRGGWSVPSRWHAGDGKSPALSVGWLGGFIWVVLVGSGRETRPLLSRGVVNDGSMGLGRVVHTPPPVGPCYRRNLISYRPKLR